TAEIQQARAEAATLQQQVEELRQRIVQEVPTAADSPEIRQLRARERELASQIAVLRQGVADEMSRLRARIQDVDSEIRNAEATLARFEQYDRAQRRIAELEAEERRLAQEFEELERQLSLLDRFVQAKVRLLTDRINAKFQFARFQLFRTLVN